MAYFRRSRAVKLAAVTKEPASMVRRLLLATACLSLAHGALAQPAAPPIIEMQGREAPPPPGPRVRLFISPMGEPFRGEDGFGAWLAAADHDRNGAVSLAEFRADADRFFKLLDADGSGFIDGFETQAYERERVPEIASVSFEEGGPGRRGGGLVGRRGGPPRGDQPQADAGGGFRGAGRSGAARFSLLNIPQPVANCDEDGNGRVTAAEWGHAADRRFAVLDKARSGALTRDALRPPPGAERKKP
jgi:hypothetical protein